MSDTPMTLEEARIGLLLHEKRINQLQDRVRELEVENERLRKDALKERHGFSLVVCRIGVNRSGIDSGKLDYELDVEAVASVSVVELLETIGAIKRSCTITAALAEQGGGE